MKQNFLILIGGAPTTGKSTLAKFLAKEMAIPWISCDQIRENAKGLLRNYKDDFPDLFVDKDITAEEYYAKYSSQEVAELERRQSVGTFEMFKGWIQYHYPWNSFILEGVNIIPEFVELVLKEQWFDGKVIPIFLVDQDEDRIRDVVFNRGLWGPAKSYSDSVKEKEFEWVSIFANKVIQDSRKHGYPIFEVDKTDSEFLKILEYINGTKN